MSVQRCIIGGGGAGRCPMQATLYKEREVVDSGGTTRILRTPLCAYHYDELTNPVPEDEPTVMAYECASCRVVETRPMGQRVWAGKLIACAPAPPEGWRWFVGGCMEPGFWVCPLHPEIQGEG